jgi:hypothetical protein
MMLLANSDHFVSERNAHFHSIYGLTVAHSSSCNPPPYSPYSLPRKDNERLWWYALWTGSNY